MKKLNCRLVVSDFDGTLANSKNCVDKEVVDAINAYVAAGGLFAVCTGRILPSILPRVREMGLRGLVVACQGSVIADIATGEIIRDVPFGRGQAAEICAFAEELGYETNVYYSDGLYTSFPEGNPYLEIYEEITGLKALHTEKKLSEFTKESPLAFNKVAILCRKSDRANLFSRLCSRFEGKYDVTCSAEIMVEISPIGETKGKALRFLAEYYGIPIERTCAVGDNLNDLSMLEAAGYGFAVANCTEGLKDKACVLPVTNDQGAVKWVIENYGYAKND